MLDEQTRAVLLSTRSPLAPMAHQLEGLRRIAERPRRPSDQDVFALEGEMGTGKSKIVCDEWSQRVYARDLHDLIVWAPAGSYENWFVDHEDEPSELTKQLPPELRERALIAGWRSGSSRARRAIQDLVRARGRPRVLVVNDEAISAVRDARLACQEFLESSPGAMAVKDESTRIRNPSADRTKYILRFGAMARARRIMSGLMSPKSPLDLFSQYQFLDWRILGFRDYWPFKSRYAVTRPMQIWARGKSGEAYQRQIRVTVGYRNVDELRSRRMPYTHRVLKRDCLDLPDKVYMPVRHVEMTREQRRVYDEMLEFCTTELESGGHVTGTSAIQQILKLHQVACGFVIDEEGRAHEVPSAKLDELVEVLREHGGKAVIWTCYQEHVRMIERRLVREFGEGCAVLFYGGNRSTRGEGEARWKRPDGPPFLVATTGAGGVGNNWIAASLSVYVANDYDLEHRAQSEDRIHRKGQTRGAAYAEIVTRGSVDEKILHALRHKIDMATAITGENYRDWLI
jgi:Mesyanzhinovviridae DNA helicase